jgi:hypothetical protein
MPTATWMPNPKKSHKIEIHYACGSGGTWACGARCLRLRS